MEALLSLSLLFSLSFARSNYMSQLCRFLISSQKNASINCSQIKKNHQKINHIFPKKMDDKGKSNVIVDDKVFIRLDDNDNDNVNDNDTDLLTSFKNSFKTLSSAPVIDIDDDDDDNNNDNASASSSNRRREIKLNPNPGPLAQPFTCDMCANTKPKYKSINIKGCTHFFCCECIENHVFSKLGDGTTDVCCPAPNCWGTLDPEYCRDFVSKEVYDLWGEKLCEFVISDGQKCYCPFVDCSILLVKDGVEDITMAECPYCHRMFCAVCRVVWHQGVSCEEYRIKLNDG
ncbi:hypothetical protein RND81_06G176500 [Saponaria officinalis]|uniref:RBR-type E3 ubiquitin transferase n=1 Tax=Saponaria officinalis TaxID=3572 RepID=A0AAW1K7Z5_SAPOF